MPKPKSLVALLAVLGALAVVAATAAAARLPQPVLGPWKIAGAGGFTLKKSSGKVVLTGFHMFVPCEEKSIKATVLGSQPLKVFSRGGYSTWGVGKNVGGEAEPMAVKVSASGRTYSGAFSAIWNYEDPVHRLLGASISFNGCSAEALGAKPK